MKKGDPVVPYWILLVAGVTIAVAIGVTDGAHKAATSPPPQGTPQRTVQELPSLFRPPVVRPSAATRRTQLQPVLEEIHAEGDASFDAVIEDYGGAGPWLILYSPAFTEKAVNDLKKTSLPVTLRAQGYAGVQFRQRLGSGSLVWVLRGPNRIR